MQKLQHISKGYLRFLSLEGYENSCMPAIGIQMISDNEIAYFSKGEPQ